MNVKEAAESSRGRAVELQQRLVAFARRDHPDGTLPFKPKEDTLDVKIGMLNDKVRQTRM